LKGTIDEELGDHDAAKHEYMEAARVASTDDKQVMRAALAAVAFDEHRWQDTIDEATMALAENDDADATLFQRAAARFALGDLDGAIADATAAIRARSGVPRYYAFRAGVHAARGDLRDASLDLAEAARTGKRSAYTLAALARWDADHGALDRAALLADAAVESGERVPAAFVARAIVREAQGKHDAATADIARALDLDPLDEDAKRLQSGFPALAIAAPLDAASLDKTIAAGGAPPRAFRERAKQRFAKGDFELASQDVERAIDGDAIDAEALLLRARIGIAYPAARRSDADTRDDLEIVRRVAPDLAADADAIAKEMKLDAKH
jgi:hypothetical protein